MSGPSEGSQVARAREAVHRAGPFRALGHRFDVVTSDRDLAGYLDDLFAAMAGDEPPGEPVAHYRVVRRAGDPAAWVVARDGHEVVRTTEGSNALAMLLWDVNRSVVERTGGLLLLHAAAAERDGWGVVLPGAMEAGKTTIVAGLVRAGLRYLTDEVTAIDPERLWVHPYPKALSVDPGSWEVLADLEPAVPDGARPFLPDQWQVVPASVRPGAVAPGARPRLVVLPRYEPGAALRLTALSRADALVAVSGCAFRFSDDPVGVLQALAGVLGACDTYELVHSDLRAAVGAVTGLLDRLSGEPAASDAQGGGALPESSWGEQLGDRRHTPARGERSMARTISPEEVALDFAPRRHPAITGVELDGEVVLYAGEGTMHKLDPIATVLWHCFDGSVTLEELVDDLGSVYSDAGADRIGEDVLDCVRELGRQGLLENVAVASPAARDAGA